MTLFDPLRFEPTRQAAQARLNAVNPAAYARTRNALDGAVTRLSPYLTHGVLSLREVYDAINARHPLDAKHKFVFELGWRAYWRHVWEHLGDDIHQPIHAGLLPEHAYQPELPADVLEARTGIPAIDQAVCELYETGYLHNHARMWLTSYLVHLRKVHWHAGAQWMLGHLLDGDVASNHLSWQWVAGTGSSKPYLFNAENVAKYAPAHWHSPGTCIDTSYEALEELARHAAAVDTRFDVRRAGAGVVQPLLSVSPSDTVWQLPGGTDSAINGLDVYLHHPWSLGGWVPECSAQVKEETAKRAGDTEQNTSVPTILGAHREPIPGNTIHVAVGFDTCHASTPWSALRWDFVTRGLQEHTQHLWWGSTAQIAAALRGARSVQWLANPHVDAALLGVQSHVQPCLFEPVDVYCRSFSEWWKRTRIAQAPKD